MERPQQHQHLPGNTWGPAIRGFVCGVALTIFSLPHILKALKELPARDDEAIGRHLADLLHLKDLALVLVSPFGMYVHHLVLAIKMLFSLAAVQLINHAVLKPASRRHRLWLLETLQSPWLGIWLSCAIGLASVHVILHPPSLDQVSQYAAALQAPPPSSRVARRRDAHQEPDDPLDSAGVWLQAAIHLYVRALAKGFEVLRAGPTAPVTGWTDLEDPLQQLWLQFGLAVLCAVILLGDSLRLTRRTFRSRGSLNRRTSTAAPSARDAQQRRTSPTRPTAHAGSPERAALAILRGRGRDSTADRGPSLGEGARKRQTAWRRSLPWLLALPHLLFVLSALYPEYELLWLSYNGTYYEGRSAGRELCSSRRGGCKYVHDRQAQERAFRALSSLVDLMFYRSCATMCLLVVRRPSTDELSRLFLRILRTPPLPSPLPSSAPGIRHRLRGAVNLIYLQLVAPFLGLVLVASRILAAAPPTFLFWHAVALRLEASRSIDWELLAALGASCGLGAIGASLTSMLSRSSRPMFAPPPPPTAAATAAASLRNLKRSSALYLLSLLDLTCLLVRFHAAWWPLFRSLDPISRSFRLAGLGDSRGVQAPAAAAMLLLLPTLLSVQARMTDAWLPAGTATPALLEGAHEAAYGIAYSREPTLPVDDTGGNDDNATEGGAGGAGGHSADDASWPIESANPWLRGVLSLLTPPLYVAAHPTSAGGLTMRSHEAAALSAASGGGVGAGGVSVVGVGNVGGVGGGGASMRATEAPASGAGQRVVHFLQATFSDPMPWELQPPLECVRDELLSPLVNDLMRNYLPHVASLVEKAANETLLSGTARSTFVAGLREVLAQQEELQAPESVRLPRQALKSFCDVLEGGAIIGLSGRLRGDIASSCMLRVSFALRSTGRLAVFGKAFKRHVVEALATVAGLPVHELVEPGDADKLLQTVKPESGDDVEVLTRFAAHLPFEHRANGLHAADRLRAGLVSANKASELLLPAWCTQDGVVLELLYPPEVSELKGANGKLPTPLHAIREALQSDDLPEEDKASYVAGPDFERYYMRSDIEWNFGQEAVNGTCFNIVLSPFGKPIIIHLSELSLRDVDVALTPGAFGLRWEEPATDAPPGRIGSLKIRLDLKPKHAVLSARMGAFSPNIQLPITPLDLDFKGGRVTAEASLDVEGGVTLAKAGEERRLPLHVQQGGAGIYLSLDKVEFGDEEFELSEESWRQLDLVRDDMVEKVALLRVPDAHSFALHCSLLSLSLSPPQLLSSGRGFARLLTYIPALVPVANAVLPAFQSLVAGFAAVQAQAAATAANLGLRRRSTAVPSTTEGQQPPSPPSQMLSLNHIANLIVEAVSNIFRMSVQKMPINNVAMAESAFRAHFQYLVAAKARQRQREAIAHGREGLSLHSIHLARRVSQQWLGRVKARLESTQDETQNAAASQSQTPQPSNNWPEGVKTWFQSRWHSIVDKNASVPSPSPAVATPALGGSTPAAASPATAGGPGNMEDAAAPLARTAERSAVTNTAGDESPRAAAHALTAATAEDEEVVAARLAASFGLPSVEPKTPGRHTRTSDSTATQISTQPQSPDHGRRVELLPIPAEAPPVLRGGSGSASFGTFRVPRMRASSYLKVRKSRSEGVTASPMLRTADLKSA